MVTITRMHTWSDDLLEFSGPVVKIRSEWGVVCRQLGLEKILVYKLMEADAKKYTQHKQVHGDRDFQVYRQKGKGNFIVPVGKGFVNVDRETEGLLNVLEKSIVNNAELDGVLERMLQVPSRRRAAVEIVRRWQIKDWRFHPDVHWSAIDTGAVKRNSLRPMTKKALIVALLRVYLMRRQRQGARIYGKRGPPSYTMHRHISPLQKHSERNYPFFSAC